MSSQVIVLGGQPLCWDGVPVPVPVPLKDFSNPVFQLGYMSGVQHAAPCPIFGGTPKACLNFQPGIHLTLVLRL